MTLIETNHSVVGKVGQHIINNPIIQFDPTLLNSSVSTCDVPAGLVGKYVLAEECTRFVLDHCALKLRFFMILSGVLIFCLLVLMWRQGYFKGDWQKIKNYINKKEEGGEND